MDQQKIYTDMIAFRRWMHQHPELSEKEIHTSEKIHEILLNYEIEHLCNIGGYGIAAIVRGEKPGPTVAAKTDIDALPVQESWPCDFASQNPGVMHACGHDANTAILLGTAIRIKNMEKELAGNVKFFFECAEETIGGGELMVKEGCMEHPGVDAIIGLHVMPYLDTGMVEVKTGCLNAATNEVEILIHGVPGHAAEPEQCIDPIVVLAYILTALQTFVSRNTAPTDSAVLTFGRIGGGTKGNIIPETASAKGTLRTLLPAQREQAKKRIREISESVAAGFGARAEVKITDSYDAVINDAALTSLIADEAKKQLGESSVVTKEAPSMGAEDFSFYTKKARGAYFHLGCKSPEEKVVFPLHTDQFHLDETCIETGIRIQTSILLRMLQQGGNHV